MKNKEELDKFSIKATIAKAKIIKDGCKLIPYGDTNIILWECTGKDAGYFFGYFKILQEVSAQGKSINEVIEKLNMGKCAYHLHKYKNARDVIDKINLNLKKNAEFTIAEILELINNEIAGLEKEYSSYPAVIKYMKNKVSEDDENKTNTDAA